MQIKRQKIFLLGLDVFTIILWLWLIVEFASQGKFSLPSLLPTIYIIVLTFYASDKEIRRWKGGIGGERRGELFVFLWMMTFIILVAYYIFYGQERGYAIPSELPTLSGSVMIIYIITDYLKKEFKKK